MKKNELKDLRFSPNKGNRTNSRETKKCFA